VGDNANLFVSALDGVVQVGRYGRRTGDAGVVVSEAREVGLANVTARKGRRAALVDAARVAFGVELPSLPRCVEGRDMGFIWSGPDQWLAFRHPAPAAGMEAALAGPLAGLAAIVDQSHGRTLVRVTGPRVRDALAKGIAIDLHPREFKTGYAAVTAVAHIGVHFWQTDGRPTYDFAVPRGFVLSFWHWLEASAAELGLEFASASRSELLAAVPAR
jgi:heterotetrameric sarcosine oxidase gamma subunit